MKKYIAFHGVSELFIPFLRKISKCKITKAFHLDSRNVMLRIFSTNTLQMLSKYLYSFRYGTTLLKIEGKQGEWFVLGKQDQNSAEYAFFCTNTQQHVKDKEDQIELLNIRE